MRAGVIVYEPVREKISLGILESLLSTTRSVGLSPDFASVVCSARELKGLLSRRLDALVLFSRDAKAAEAELFGVGFKKEIDGYVGDYPLLFLTDEDDAKRLITEFFERTFKKKIGRVSFGLLGVDGDLIAERTREISALHKGVFFDCNVGNEDKRVTLFYGEETPKMVVDEAIKDFIVEFRDEIYAEDETGLYETFFNAMKLRGKTVTTAESMTGGRIAANIISVKGASEIFYEGFVTYDTRAKIERLGVDSSSVKAQGVVSAVVAHEMAKGLLEKGKANVAISITGYAGGKTETEDDGLCYIGVGVGDDVSVYKYKFKGTRERVIKNAADTAIFVTLKKVLATD